jgi:hypothetical protein
MNRPTDPDPSPSSWGAHRGLALAVALSNNIAETPEAKALAEKAAEEAVAKLYREQSEALAKAVKDIERLVRQKFSEDARPPCQMSLTAPNRGLTGKQRAALDLQRWPTSPFGTMRYAQPASRSIFRAFDATLRKEAGGTLSCR